MKRYIILLTIICISCIFTYGCRKAQYIKLPYSIEYAYSNKDVIDIICGNKVYNIEKIDDFVDSVAKKKKAEIRITKYNDMDYNIDWNEPEQIYDLSYDGKYINVTIYNNHSIPINETKADVIIASEHFKYHKIVKEVNDLAIQYSLEKSGNNRIYVMSFVKNGYIGIKQQKYLQSVIGDK